MSGPTRRPRIVGIDPSLVATGVARSDGQTRRIGEPGITTLSVPMRSQAIRRLATQIVGATMMSSGHLTRDLLFPGLVVMELPSMGAAYGGNLERVGLFWEICRIFDQDGVPVVAPTAGQRLKYLNDDGKGTNIPKTQVVERVTRIYPEFETGGDDNICDALVYLAMGLDQYGHPLTKRPAAARKVLGLIRNPDKSSAWPTNI